MSPIRDEFRTLYQGFPRVSGDEPYTSAYVDQVWAFSPREWG